MVEAELGPRRGLVTKDGKPFATIDGILITCDLFPVAFGRKRGIETFIEGIIDLAGYLDKYYASRGIPPHQDRLTGFLQRVSSVTKDEELSPVEKTQRIIGMFEFVHD